MSDIKLISVGGGNWKYPAFPRPYYIYKRPGGYVLVLPDVPDPDYLARVGYPSQYAETYKKLSAVREAIETSKHKYVDPLQEQEWNARHRKND